MTTFALLVAASEPVAAASGSCVGWLLPPCVAPPPAPAEFVAFWDCDVLSPFAVLLAEPSPLPLPDCGA